MIIKKHSLLIIALTLNLHTGLLISADPSHNSLVSIADRLTPNALLCIVTARDPLSTPDQYKKRLILSNILLEKGANVDVADAKGRTALGNMIVMVESQNRIEWEFAKQFFLICQSKGLMTRAMYDAAIHGGIVTSDVSIIKYLRRPNNGIAGLFSRSQGGPITLEGHDLAGHVATFLNDPQWSSFGGVFTRSIHLNDRAKFEPQ